VTSALRVLICGAIEKHLRTYLLTSADPHYTRRDKDKRHSQCSTTATEDITRRPRPEVFAYAGDASSPVDISYSRLHLDARSVATADVIVCTVQSAAARSPAGRQHKQENDCPRKTRRQLKKGRSQTTTVDVLYTGTRHLPIISAFYSGFFVVFITRRTRQQLYFVRIRKCRKQQLTS